MQGKTITSETVQKYYLAVCNADINMSASLTRFQYIYNLIKASYNDYKNIFRKYKTSMF